MAHDFRIFKRILEISLVCFLLFFVDDHCSAYSNNFNSIATGTDIGTVFDGGIIDCMRRASNADLSIDNNALVGTSNFLNYRGAGTLGNMFFWESYCDSLFADVGSFDFYLPSNFSGSFYFEGNDISNNFSISQNLGIKGICGTSTYIVANSISVGAWHSFNWSINNNEISLLLDGASLATTTCATNLDYNYGFTLINTAGQSFYIDNFSTGEIQIPSIDYLAFNIPFYGTDYSVYDFSWKLLYELSTTTIATYPTEKLGLSIEWKNTNTGVIGLPTTTGIAKISSLDLSEFLPDIISDYSWDNRIFVPTQLGNYIATATMYHYNYDTLVSTEIITATTTWTMSTGTPQSVDSGWCKNLCWDIASSTTFLDSLTNSIICGGRYVMCYTFQPHDSVVYLVGDSIEKIKDSFPFNAYFGLTDTVKEVISTTTVDTDATIGLPMIRKIGTTSEYYIMPLLGSTTMQSTIGSANASMVKTTLGWLSWVIVAGIILVVIS